MQSNKVYWENKQARKEHAIAHTERMEHDFDDKIERSIRGTQIYNRNIFMAMIVSARTRKAKITVENLTTVEAIKKYQGSSLQDFKDYKSMLVLNFASYKNPGGKFLEGSFAQEESLCHESFLYNVLRRFDKTYYEQNRFYTNKCLYRDVAIYTPYILFQEFNENGDERWAADILTCAAPNYKAAKRYYNVTEEENLKALESRINFVMRVITIHQPRVLILGAFGCGVFGQDPNVVASMFKNAIDGIEYQPEQIIFAIPYNFHKENYEAFQKIFSD